MHCLRSLFDSDLHRGYQIHGLTCLIANFTSVFSVQYNFVVVGLTHYERQSFTLDWNGCLK